MATNEVNEAIFAERTIVFGVTGGIAAYKSVGLASRWTQRGARVPLADLHEHPANPNQMTEEQRRLLAFQIEDSGHYPPLVVRPHPELAGEILLVMRRLAEQGMTMLVVTHEMTFAADVADRVLFIDHGVIVEQGPARDLLTNPQHQRTQAFLHAVLDRAPMTEGDEAALGSQAPRSEQVPGDAEGADDG